MGTLITVVLFLWIAIARGQTVDDIIGTAVNEPICVSVTANDAVGTTLTSFTNSTNGKTYTNFPAFFYANSSNVVVMEAENYQIANWENVGDPNYYASSAAYWTRGNNTGASGGLYVFPAPVVGSNTGKLYGRSVVYNIMFRTTGTYNMAILGKGTNENSDSAHVLFQANSAASVTFVTKSGSAWNGVSTGSFHWDGSSYTIAVTSAYTIAKYFIAVREDGLQVDQVYLSMQNSGWSPGNGGAQPQSRFISCSSNQILYFPQTGWSGIDTFTYRGTSGSSTSTGTVSVYVGVPLPPVSPTPSPSASPSSTPSPSTSQSASPSVTPSRSASPSLYSSPSLSPSNTPSISVSPSITPSSSITPTISPSASITPSGTPSPSITPTPSPLPPMCDGIPSISTGVHTLLPFNDTSNFGQTFKPFASGNLLSVSFHRADADTGVLNGTAYLLLGVVSDPDSGVTIRSFPFSMSGTGVQTFTFDPPQRLDTTRYLFLLDSIRGDSPAAMVLSDSVLVSQYAVLDQEINAQKTAVFSYCMVPDYIPSPSPSASTLPSPSPTPSARPAEDSAKKSNTGAAVGAATGVIVFVLIGVAVVFLLIRRRKQNKKSHGEISPQTDLELHSASASTRQGEMPYQPIGLLKTSTGHYSVIPAVESKWNINYNELALTKEIGRGAFGVVYQGTWKNVPVAVKQALVDSKNLQMQDFFGEAEVMKKLKPHPNVTRLLGLCFNPVCIVLEFVDNGSLWSWLESDKPLDVKTQISIARGIAAGILHLHNEGIIHRDLAARNILLDSSMCPKVSDFGMSRQVLENKTNKTVSEIGPIRWMAPEAMRQRVYNKKTDAWSYGAVLYEILTRTMPFHQYDLVHVATSVSLKELSLVPEIKKDAEEKKYPRVIVTLLEACLAFEPENRPDFEKITEILESSNDNL